MASSSKRKGAIKSVCWNQHMGTFLRKRQNKKLRKASKDECGNTDDYMEGLVDTDDEIYEDEQYVVVPLDILSSIVNHAVCPCCDGSGAYYDLYGDVCQCQWCDEKQKIVTIIGTQQ